MRERCPDRADMIPEAQMGTRVRVVVQVNYETALQRGKKSI
jgi:hypothetical protein